MKKSLVLVLILVSLIFATAVFAIDATNPQDAYVRSTDPDTNFNDAFLSAVGSNLGACTPSDITYLKWDVAAPIDGSASLVLNRNFQIGAATGQLTLYQVLDDTWAETTITYNNRPALGPAIMNIPIPVANGPVTFTGQALVNYLTAQAADDGTASFAIQVDGCTQFGPNGIRMDSKETTTGTPPQLSTTTAIEMQSFSATNNGISPVVWVGLLLVVVLGLGAFVTMRRRDSAAG